MTMLTVYIATALATWFPPATAEIRLREETVATDIVHVVDDPSEPVVFGSKAEDALVLAFLSVAEGGMAAWVDDGRCNDKAWRAGPGRALLASGDCDGGRAYSLWQIHVGAGVALTPSGGWVSAHYAAPGASIVSKHDVLSDRKTAVRVALHIVRESVRVTKGLAGYTGERGARHPKADYRLNMPRAYLRQRSAT